MLSAILIALLGASFLVAGLTYTFFWYEAVNDPHPSHGRCRATLARCVALGFLSSVASQLAVCLTYPLGWAGRLWKPRPSPGCRRPPVLLVHGLYHNASAWCLYAWLLRRRGYEKVHAISYDTFRKDFRELAGEIKAAVSETAGLCGGRPVLLIGHSMGGLLARAAVADPATAAKVRAVVTLGSPHRGSRLAALALNALGRSLAYDGPLARLLARTPSPPDMPRLNIYSPLDNMVLPTSSLEAPEDGWAQAVTAPISHLAMLYHLPTARLVLDSLDEIAPLAQEDCRERGN